MVRKALYNTCWLSQTYQVSHLASLLLMSAYVHGVCAQVSQNSDIDYTISMSFNLHVHMRVMYC